jgi:hypothetical protein
VVQVLPVTYGTLCRTSVAMICRHLSARWQVVVARPLVADRRRGHDHVPECQLWNEDARAAGCHEGATPQGDELLEEPGRQWRADARMHDREPRPAVLDLVDRVLADLRAEPRDFPATVLTNDALDDLLEVAQDDVGGDVARLDHRRRLDHRLGARVELEDR